MQFVVDFSDAIARWFHNASTLEFIVVAACGFIVIGAVCREIAEFRRDTANDRRALRRAAGNVKSSREEWYPRASH